MIFLLSTVLLLVITLLLPFLLLSETRLDFLLRLAKRLLSTSQCLFQLLVTVVIMNLCMFALLFLGFAVTVTIDAQTELASDLSKRGRVVEGCDGGLSCGDLQYTRI